MDATSKFRAAAVGFVLCGLSGPALAAGTGLLTGPSNQANPVARQYAQAVGQQLFDQFGAGSSSRTLYCSGPVVVGFQIGPDGNPRNLKLLLQSEPGYDADLIVSIANMRFPKFPNGMEARPITEIYRYAVSRFAKPFLAARYNCR